MRNDPRSHANSKSIHLYSKFQIKQEVHKKAKKKVKRVFIKGLAELESYIQYISDQSQW